MSFYYDGRASSFLLHGLMLVKSPIHSSQTVSLRRFRANFGVSPIVCEKLWYLLIKFEDVAERSRCTPTHLLYALLFLKTYGTEAQLKAVHGRDEKSFRNWTWTMLEHISNLSVEVVSEANRKEILKIKTHFFFLFIQIHLHHRFAGRID